MFALAVILVLAVQGPPQAPSTGGSLIGCALDEARYRLPGVTIVAKTGRVQRTTMTDARGCYELRDLTRGSYRVTARLAGFDNVTRDGVTIAPASVVPMDFAMRVSTICECVRFGRMTLGEQWEYADAVLHVRLSASEPQPTTPVGYYRHVATVLNALKKPVGPLTTPVFVLQNQRSGAAGPYDIHQELVMFLKSWGSGGFAITNDDPELAVPRGSFDPAIVFLVQDSRIQRAPSDFSRYVGMRLDGFLRSCALFRVADRGEGSGR